MKIKIFYKLMLLLPISLFFLNSCDYRSKVVTKLGPPVFFEAPPESSIPSGEKGKIIKRGKELLTQTYKLLPNHVGDKLNCVSCHLNGGTKPKAAPWVGVSSMYPKFRSRNARVNTLEDRINGCMQRSMNGKPLEVSSPEMKAMVAYMDWLSQNVPKGRPVSGRGIPRLKALTPNPERGKTLYAAKCASCHQPNGQGLYPQGTYAFPALWGENSYNIGAGMARLNTAAAFIKWNMPLGEGGTLTDQEAYDIASFFIYKKRPDFQKKHLDWPKGGKPSDARY